MLYEFFNFVVWTPDPNIFSIFNLEVRWYGLLFALGFILALQIMYYLFKKEDKPGNDVESLAIYMIFAVIIGARLGHVLFYEPEIYLSDPVKILKIWEGGLSGFGAVLGIIIGLFIYRNFYIKLSFKDFKFDKTKRKGQSYLWIADKVVIAAALIACCIRIGNLINSEEVGKPTDAAWGFVFAWDAKEQLLKDNLIAEVETYKPSGNSSEVSTEPDAEALAPVAFNAKFVTGDYEYQEENVRSYIEDNLRNNLKFSESLSNIKIPEDKTLNYNISKENDQFIAEILVFGIKRHPVQLYEAFTNFFIFIILFWLWSSKRNKMHEGMIMAVFLISYFTLFFIYEFLKAETRTIVANLPLSIEQWLSIVMILTGIILLILQLRQKNRHHSQMNSAPVH